MLLFRAGEARWNQMETDETFTEQKRVKRGLAGMNGARKNNPDRFAKRRKDRKGNRWGDFAAVRSRLPVIN